MSFTTDTVIDIKELSVYQEEQLILENVNFSLSKGEFVYIIGSTGSGKSSLLKTLYADLPYSHGSITCAGFDLDRLKRKDISLLRRKLGIIFQDFQLLPDRTVAENLYFIMKATGWTNKSKMTHRLSEVLMRVGLDSAGNKQPHQLSGGEQQRVAIARALINEPVLLIADEPTGNLDPAVAEGILKLFQEINNSGTAILMATHNHQFIDKFPGRVLKCSKQSILDSNKTQFELSDVW